MTTKFVIDSRIALMFLVLLAHKVEVLLPILHTTEDTLLLSYQCSGVGFSLLQQ